jgi:hypothetical protein
MSTPTRRHCSLATSRGLHFHDGGCLAEFESLLGCGGRKQVHDPQRGSFGGLCCEMQPGFWLNVYWVAISQHLRMRIRCAGMHHGHSCSAITEWNEASPGMFPAVPCASFLKTGLRRQTICSTKVEERRVPCSGAVPKTVDRRPRETPPALHTMPARGTDVTNTSIILAARLLLATPFLIFGRRKLRDFSGTVSQTAQLGAPTPVPAAGVATLMELRLRSRLGIAIGQRQARIKLTT